MGDTSDNTDIKDNSETKKVSEGITFEIPGVKICFSGNSALFCFAFLTIIISALIAFIVYEKPDAITDVISSINPKGDPGNSSKKNEQLVFWVPSSQAYVEKRQEFESWLSANYRWWGKVQLTNIRNIDGKRLTMDGFQYTAEEIEEKSEIKDNQQYEVQNQALRLFKINDLNLMWIEMDRREHF